MLYFFVRNGASCLFGQKPYNRAKNSIEESRAGVKAQEMSPFSPEADSNPSRRKRLDFHCPDDGCGGGTLCRTEHGTRHGRSRKSCMPVSTGLARSVRGHGWRPATAVFHPLCIRRQDDAPEACGGEIRSGPHRDPGTRLGAEIIRNRFRLDPDDSTRLRTGFATVNQVPSTFVGRYLDDFRSAERGCRRPAHWAEIP